MPDNGSSCKTWHVIRICRCLVAPCSSWRPSEAVRATYLAGLKGALEDPFSIAVTSPQAASANYTHETVMTRQERRYGKRAGVRVPLPHESRRAGAGQRRFRFVTRPRNVSSFAKHLFSACSTLSHSVFDVRRVKTWGLLLLLHTQERAQSLIGRPAGRPSPPDPSVRRLATLTGLFYSEVKNTSAFPVDNLQQLRLCSKTSGRGCSHTGSTWASRRERFYGNTRIQSLTLHRNSCMTKKMEAPDVVTVSPTTSF